MTATDAMLAKVLGIVLGLMFGRFMTRNYMARK